MITIPMTGATVIHQTIGKHDASRVMIKPPLRGTGVIAGGAVRQILEAAGIKDALASRSVPPRISMWPGHYECPGRAASS